MRFFKFALPLVFLLVLFSAAPRPAYADTPTGPQNGMFDCLGSYDWGCRIVSFLFDDKDNEVTYIKDNQPVTEQPGPIESSLRKMMGFFSNAMLIIASLMLLYHLIVMVAETAHSGTIGGKEANQLWAPIRLVIAIGLLVPISSASGLNSGQYIVAQIAKWGSGLASQTWKVFAEGLTESQTLVKPTYPRIYTLGMNTFKSYVCMTLINYYSEKTGSDTDKITDKIMRTSPKQIAFVNTKNQMICGQINYKSVNQTQNEIDSVTEARLTTLNESAFDSAKWNLQQKAMDIAQKFIPDYAATTDEPSIDTVESAIESYQQDVENQLNSSGVEQNLLKQISNNIKNGAESQGWTSAGAWFLAITRAQGAIITGGMNIPDATGPNPKLIAEVSPAAARDYQKFDSWLINRTGKKSDTGPFVSPQFNTGLQPHISVQNEAEIAQETNSFVADIVSAANQGGQKAIDVILGGMDKTAIITGLWGSDPKKAFGDLGGSTNPFGEIAELGYKKIRLGLNYLGMSAALSTGAYLTNWSGWKTFVGSILVGLSSVLTMFATLFLLAGVLLGFVVPLLPFIHFTFAIMTWLGTLLEAMICMPFFALAHLTPKGEGFTGPNARTGYYLIFQVFLRPALTIFGLIGSLLLFYVMAKFLNAMYYEATGGITLFESASMIFMQKLIFSILYAGIIYITANTSFKMIEHIPKHALRWMGAGVQEEGYEGHGEFLGLAGAVGGQQLISNLTQQTNFSTIAKAAGQFKSEKEIGRQFTPDQLNLRRLRRDPNTGEPVRDAQGNLQYDKVWAPSDGSDRAFRASQKKTALEGEINTQATLDQNQRMQELLDAIRGGGGLPGGPRPPPAPPRRP